MSTSKRTILQAADVSTLTVTVMPWTLDTHGETTANPLDVSAVRDNVTIVNNHDEIATY